MAQQKPSARRSRKKGWSNERIMLWSIIVLLIAIALLLWGPFKGTRTAEKKRPAAKKEAPRDRTAKAVRPDEPAEITAVVAIVIDDLGQDLQQATDVLALPERVTLAVMPRLPQSRRTADLARKEGREVIIHIPMEAKGAKGKREAPGTLRSDMTPMEFIAALNENLDSVPGAAGANNHEGSALTENREAMNFLMSELKARGLFFLDSYTDAGSVAYASAREFGLKAARRDVFLDNDSDKPVSIRKQLETLAQVAKKNGRAIGIGHPHPETLAELRKWFPEAAEEGIKIVPLSRLMQ
jgi:polysaccharide deacetylase 2 family uncharacterized protein YibQ